MCRPLTLTLSPTKTWWRGNFLGIARTINGNPCGWGEGYSLPAITRRRRDLAVKHGEYLFPIPRRRLLVVNVTVRQ